MELLSPAGSMEALKAAVDAKADAVYLGLPVFNARRPAKNFGMAEIAEGVKYAHDSGTKIYVTLNIDLKSSELKLLFRVLQFLVDIKVDAVITKDWSVLYLIEKYYSSLEVHLSTQFGVANSYAMEKAKELGATRVVLARELNFDELEMLKGKDLPEVEAFVQGSMCFSFSGRCLLSSWVGGKSANRGVCQAPCRLKYEVRGDGVKGDKVSCFSMKDLSLVAYLNKLEELDVASLKIEGRLKNPGWVKEITSIYRNSLDNMDQNLNEESISNLKLFSGRELSEGFTTGLTDLTSEHNIKFGTYLGKVLKVEKGMAVLDFCQKGKGTSLRFVKDKFLGIAFDLPERLEEDEAGNGLVAVSDSVLAGADVYEVIVSQNEKVGSVGQNRFNIVMEALENTIKIEITSDVENITFLEKYKKVVKAKRGVDAEIIGLKLEEKYFNGWKMKEFVIKEPFLLSKSQANNMIGEISRRIAIINKNATLKNIEIKNREILDELVNSDEIICSENKKSIKFGNITSLRILATDIDTIIDDIKNSTVKQVIIDEAATTDLEKIISLSKVVKVVISLFPIIFEKEIAQVEELVAKLEKKGKFSYEANDLGHLKLLQKYTSDIVGGPGIAPYNYISAVYLKKLGLKAVYVPYEIDMNGLKDLAFRADVKLRMCASGRIPLFYSRVQSEKFAEGNTFKDSIGTEMVVHKYQEINTFYSKEKFSIRDLDFGDIQVGELIANFSGEPDIVKKITNLKHGNFAANSKPFNLERKLS